MGFVLIEIADLTGVLEFVGAIQLMVAV